MDTYEDMIGRNIREARQKCKLTQDQLAQRCGIAATTLSAYEHSKKIPNLTTVAKISSALGVSIERLYYGESNSQSGAAVEPVDDGERIVRAVYTLWEMGVINYYESFTSGVMIHYDQRDAVGTMLVLCKYQEQIRRLIITLDEFKIRRSTYPEPEKYLEMILASVAAEISALMRSGK